jgi:hypothetical protein
MLLSDELAREFMEEFFKELNGNGHEERLDI